MNLTKYIRILASASASLLMMASINSCSFDDTHLRDSIDDLNSRVEALEDFQSQIQSDIETLKALVEKLQAGVTIDDIVENGDGSYTINFSDGTSATIRNGEDGQDGIDGQDGLDGMTPPTIVVMEEDGTYYWGYEYPDGRREFITDENGDKIPVTGEAPQIRINEDTQRWEYSIDGGLTWNDAGAATGGSGDPLFSDVDEDEDYVYITLSDGTTITIPKTKELAFDFGTDADTLYFEAGETKVLDYTMSGDESHSISKPDGWRASIESDSFAITAPAAENTFAETEGTITVLLTSANGQSAIASLAVAIGEQVEEPEPELPDYDPLVGDFYYSDGTWSTQYDGSKTAIGIVIWAGDPTQDDAFLMAEHPECNHGLVLSAVEFSGTWQENCGAYGQTIDSWRAANLPEYESLMYWLEYYVTTGPVDRILGYQHTKVLEAFNADPANSEWPIDIMPAMASFDEETPAPKTSSGWFLPSIKEMTLMNSSNFGTINSCLSSIPGGTAMNSYGYYFTSSEYVDIMPAGVSTFDTMFFSAGSTNKNFGNSYRFMLAF